MHSSSITESVNLFVKISSKHTLAIMLFSYSVEMGAQYERTKFQEIAKPAKGTH